MDQAQLQSRLMAAFVAELEEHVGALNRDTLALEQHPTGAPRDEVLRRLFRTAHTVKSAARAAAVAPIETVAHRLEDLLAAARDGEAAVDDVLLSLLFDLADALDEARGRLRDARSLEGSAVAALLARVDSLARDARASRRVRAPRRRLLRARRSGPRSPGNSAARAAASWPSALPAPSASATRPALRPSAGR
jgi:chemotaxis protein histidine kinase CheA